MHDNQILEMLKQDKEELKSKLEEAQNKIDFMLSTKKFSIPQIKEAIKQIESEFILPVEDVVDKLIDILMKTECKYTPNMMSKIKAPMYSVNTILEASKHIDNEHMMTPEQIVKNLISILYRKYK